MSAMSTEDAFTAVSRVWDERAGVWCVRSGMHEGPTPASWLSPPRWMPRLPSRIHPLELPCTEKISAFQRVEDELEMRAGQALKAAAVPFVFWDWKYGHNGTIRVAEPEAENLREVRGLTVDYLSSAPLDEALPQLRRCAHDAGFDVGEPESVQEGVSRVPLLNCLLPWGWSNDSVKLGNFYFNKVRLWLGDQLFHRDIIANGLNWEDRILLYLMYPEQERERVRWAAYYLDAHYARAEIDDERMMARARALGIEDLLEQAREQAHLD